MTGPTPGAQARWSLPLIQTKMAPPLPSRRLVPRPGLVSRVIAGVQSSVCVVTAPAGFGKTTLLAECAAWLRERQHVVGWLSLDFDDEDLTQFGAYLVASLSAQPGWHRGRAEALLQDDPSTPVDTLLSVLLNQIAANEHQVHLILDDFDRINARPIRAAVARLLRYASPNLHVIFGVRSEAALQSGALQASGRLLRLHDADLRFSLEDARRFFALGGGPTLRPDDVAALNAATEGWVAGLQLATLGLDSVDDAPRRAADLSGLDGSIDAYLQDAVLAQLPESMRDFLLRTSIFDRLNDRACDAALGPGTSSWMKLDWLERHNVFLRPLDEHRNWFRYHALLLDAMRRKAARQLADELPTLHRRASHWFAAQALWPEAIRHALAAGDMALAADWVEAVADSLLDRSDVGTLLGMLARLPQPLIRLRPRLRLAHCWALGLSLAIPEADLRLRELEEDVAAGRFEEDLSEALRAEIDALGAMVAGLADDSPRALRLGRHAAEAGRPLPARVQEFARTALIFGMVYEGGAGGIPAMADRPRPASAGVRGDWARGERTLYGEVYLASMFGLGALTEGRLADARQIFERAYASAAAAVGPDSRAAVLPAGYLGALYYEHNDLRRAQDLIEGRASIVLESCPLGSVLRHRLAAAGLAQRSGDPGSALVILAEARELALSRDWVRLRAACDARTIRLLLQAGERIPARRHLEEMHGYLGSRTPADTGGSFLETWASHGEAQARVMIAMGEPGRAVELLDTVRARLLRGGMRFLACQIGILLALARAAHGPRGAWQEDLGDALGFAAEAGVVSSFVDEGAAIGSLLGEWAASGRRARSAVDPEFLVGLQAAVALAAEPQTASETPAPPSSPAGPGFVAMDGIDGLSARELEILHHVSHGLSNKEIARALRVAPETIKWHLRNVFEKLGVSSRVEAVRIVLGRERALG